MSSLTNDQHKDDLALRRRRKRAQSAARDDGPAPAVHSSQAARGLIGGLITGAPDSDKHAADPDAPPSSESPPVTLPGQVAPQRPMNSASTPAADQENIDQLIRRVREGIVTDGEAATDVSERRPQGTADLKADPAPVPRRRAWRVPKRPELSRPQTELKHVARCLAAAAAVVLGTITLLAITLTSDPRHAAPTGGASLSNRPLFNADAAQLAEKRLPSVVAITSKLHSAASQRRDTGRVSRLSHPRQSARPDKRHAVIRAVPSQPTIASDVAQDTSVSQSSTPAQRPTAPAPAQNTTQAAESTPTQSATDNNMSSPPAGPKGSNPLDGIGSCVQGC